MIGYLTGTVQNKTTDNAIILVGGVGYIVYFAPAFLSSFAVNDSISAFIHTHVKEDAIELYGFKNQEEYALFKLLLSVSGIGAKTGMLVIDRGVESVKNAISTANLDFFTTIPRLGKKNGQKIIIELKNKVGSINELDLGAESASAEVSEALQSMGYSNQEIKQALKEIPSTAGTLQEKLRFALKALAKA